MRMSSAGRARPSALAALAFSVVLGGAGGLPARAGQDQTASLSWVRLSGAEGCIGTRALAQAVEGRLSRAAFVSAARADLTIEGRVEPAGGGGWRAVFAVTDAGGALLGTREIATPAPRCDVLDDDLALAIALMIDPNAILSPGVPAPLPVPIAPAPAPPAPAPQVIVQRILIPTAPRPAPPAEPWRVDLQAGPILGLGLLPALSAGATVRARLTPPQFIALELGAVLWAPNEASSGGPSGGFGTRFTFSEGIVAACPLTIGTATRLSMCAGARIGAMSTAGFGFDLALSDARATASGALDARLIQRIVGPLAAGVGLALVVPFVRDKFYYTDANGEDRGVFRMAPLAGAVELSVGVEFY